MRTSNILDEIHAELSPLVWDAPASSKPVLKPVHAHWVKSEIYKTLERAGYTNVEDWLTLVLTGSLCTYQYSEEGSDVDISLFVDTKIFPEWSRAEMIALMVDKLDGRILPGTPFPLQDFVVGEGIKPSDLYKPGLRSGYDIDTGRWIVPPEHERVHDVKSEQGGFYAWSLQMADKMERLLRYEPEAAVRFWHQIHKKRRIDMVKGKGDYAESNIIYKMLANRGLFPALSDASGEYIARHETPHDSSDKADHTSLPPYVEKEARAMKRRSQTPSATPFRPDYGVATRPFSADDEVATRPFRPDDEEWMQGQCAAYVDGLCRLRPDLRLGIQWDDHFPTDSEDYPEGEQPEFETMPHHYFAHDDHYAYDAMGRHPLPYQGEGDRVTYDHDPKDVRHYGMYEGGYVEPAMQHAQENDIFNKDAYEQGRWNIAKTAAKDWFAPSYMVPDDVKHQIHEWAHTLPFPLGSRMAPPERYHVTGVYSPTGFSDPSHHEWIEGHSGLTYPVQTTGVESFSPSKVGDLSPIVLRVHHPQLEADTERLIDEAQQRGLPVSRFPGGYKPHITIGHSPTPLDVEHPGMSFEVGPLRELHSYYDELKGRTAGAPTKPPNLRQGSPSKNCLACKMYHKNKGGKGKCWGYGEYDVRGDQLCDSFEKETRNLLNRFTAHNLQYDRDQHPEGKGFILGDGSVWTWPTENLKPMHMQYNMKAKNQGLQPVPGSAFHIKEGKVWQYGPGRSLSPEQQQMIFAADPKLELAPSRRQEQLDQTPGFGHGQNVLNILERNSAWKFSATNIPEIARRIYEKAIEGVGATINLHGETPHTRYGFAPDPATDTPIDPEEFTPQVVEHFIAHWADRLRQPEKYVGSWVRDDGMVVLDVSEGHDDLNEANRRAFAGEQEALWDGVKNEAIPVVAPPTPTLPDSAM